jgi:hypothetical protein
MDAGAAQSFGITKSLRTYKTGEIQFHYAANGKLEAFTCRTSPARKPPRHWCGLSVNSARTKPRVAVKARLPQVTKLCVLDPSSRVCQTNRVGFGFASQKIQIRLHLPDASNGATYSAQRAPASLVEHLRTEFEPCPRCA